ncbi:MAG: MFS transporter [Micropepsaceae bacterium]
MTKPFDVAARAEWRANWRVVLGAAIGMGTGASLFSLNASLFITSFGNEFGWSRGDMGLAGAGAFIAGALTIGIMGRILDHVGFRKVVLVCVPMMALVYLGLTLMNGAYAMYVALLVVAGTFGGGTAAMVYTRPVVAVFDRQRGLALACAASGTSLATILFAPVLGAAIENYGWRAGAYGLVVLTLFVGLPLALALIGRAREMKAVEEGELAVGAAPAVELTLAEAVRGPTFWLLAGALVAVNIPGSGVVGQLAPMITDKGLSDTAAGVAMSTYAGGLLTGRLITGFALDRFAAPYVAAVMTCIPAIGTALLLIPDPSLALALFAVALIGLQQGSEIDLLAYFVSRTFGTKNYGSIYGAIATAGALSTATGLVLFGKVHDWTKTYDIALIVGTVAFVVGAMAFLAVKYVKRPNGEAAPHPSRG